MAEEQQQSWTCVLCGTRAGGYSYYHDSEDESLYLCTSCLKSVTKSVDRDQLRHMTTEQVQRHMEVRDELASTYKNSFVATKTFSVGKKRNVPIIEVDEKRELWALPKAPMPLAQSIKSIVDCKVVLSAEELNADDEWTSEIVEGLGIGDFFPIIRNIINKLYQSKHTDLAPIPEGHFVNYLEMVLTLDDQESGLNMVDIDLIPFWLSMPSNVDAGYDCAYEFLEFLKQVTHSNYEKRKALGEKLDLSCNDRLSALVARGQVAEDDAEILKYYLERIRVQGNANVPGFSHNLVKSVADAVSNHILFGEDAPHWSTQHTIGIDAFLGAFYRYAPGLSLSDVVYIMDQTEILSGKGGMLLAQDSFAVDDFTSIAKDSAVVEQPIAYDDLLFVGIEEGERGNRQLILTCRDGSSVRVNGGEYAHYLFATINCILLLRPDKQSV